MSESMPPFNSIAGRFIVGRSSLPLSGMGEVIANACRDIREIPGMPACFVEFDDLRIEALSLDSAGRKAGVRADTSHWYDSMAARQAYRLVLSNGTCFVYIFCAVDCWRSFLFPDPDPDDVIDGARMCPSIEEAVGREV